MIHLVIAPEPASFARKVREPGENALAFLAGKPLPHASAKKKRRPTLLTKVVSGTRVPKTLEDFPCWQECLDELHDAYDGICAYYCFRIEKAMLPHVDHFVAKHDGGARLAYEWSNYRLACGYANTCKNKNPNVLDPANIQDGWFHLDVLTLDVRADPNLPEEDRRAVEATIVRLKLREGRALEIRKRAMDHFRSGRVQMEFLAMEHPFVARELARQGIRTREQLPSSPPQEVLAAVEPEL